jgi:hypothetical protein
MKTLEELYQDLERYKDFRVGDNTEKFLETTDEIILRKDKGSIPILLSYFDDENDYTWVFVSLSSAMEYYESNVFVCELLKGLPILMKKAPGFADDFFSVILNTEDCRQLMIENFYLAPKKDLLDLFEVMEEEGTNHQALIDDLREKLKTMPDN